MVKLNLNKNKKLNLNGGNKLNLNKDVQNEEINPTDKEKEKYDKLSQQLYEDSIKNMKSSAINVEFNEEELTKYNKLKKKRLIRNWLISGFSIIFLSGIFVFGMKNAFFKPNYTGAEIAFLSNRFNGKTNFPESGVYGYIKQNANELMKNNMQFYNNAADDNRGINIEDPTVVTISPTNDKQANVIFQANIVTSVSSQPVNCSVTLSWDGKKYKTLGGVSIYPRELTNKVTKAGKDPNEFSTDFELDDKNLDDARIFIDNFFKMYYSKQDISPYYNGKMSLEQPQNLEYKGLENFELYTENNKQGYNCKANVILRLSNGVEYNTLKYISLVRTGKTWSIEKIY